jgi:hypothetical protein
MLLFEWASLFETAGVKLSEGKGLREGWDSKGLWKSVEKLGAPRTKPISGAPPHPPEKKLDMS